MSSILVSTFYHFTPLPEPAALKPSLLATMRALDIRGTITLAPEGINATISGAQSSIEAIIAYLRSMEPFRALNHRLSHYTAQTFDRCKVKVKPELISLGAPANPNVCVGTYVAPADWNALISRPDIITIDTRNEYEYVIGHFSGAVNPDTRSFSEMCAFTAQHLNPHTHPHVAMYCTGGIRCDKYSSYLLTQGFQHVYHLKGGILAYLESIPPAQSLWQGDCYVFDNRVAVGHGLVKNPDITMCMGCGRPLTPANRAEARYIENTQCVHCA
jgi:UPF0176 protein